MIRVKFEHIFLTKVLFLAEPPENSRSKGRRSPLKARRSISPREKSGEKSSVAVRREEAAPLIARCRSQ